MSTLPQDLKYTTEHEWARLDGDVITVGITDHAQEALGDITYVELPPVGQSVDQNDTLCAVESTKAASDVFSPVAGEVVEVNQALEDAPEAVNEDPYGTGWICRIKTTDTSQLDGLMDPAAYQTFLEDNE